MQATALFNFFLNVLVRASTVESSRSVRLWNVLTSTRVSADHGGASVSQQTTEVNKELFWRIYFLLKSYFKILTSGRLCGNLVLDFF